MPGSVRRRARISTEGLIAQVLISKYADLVSIYRQAQIYPRQDIKLNRLTLANWLDRAAWNLRPLRDRTLEELQPSERLFDDETTAPVTDPKRGRPKTGQLWAYARDDRPWGGVDPPMVVDVYAADRKAERSDSILEILQASAGRRLWRLYSARQALRAATQPRLQLVPCPAQIL